MKVLLDTNALIWSISAPARLSAQARRWIESEADEVYFGVISLWEIAIKRRLGKLSLDAGIADAAAQTSGFRLLGLETGHILRAQSLPLRPDHRDAFDHLIVAQAMHERLTLITSDRHLAAYGVPVIPA